MHSFRDHGMLNINRVSSIVGERPFCFAAPRVRNALPLSVTLATTLLMFNACLNTHLFRQAFPATFITPG